MSTDTSMRLDTGEQKRVAARTAPRGRPRAAARPDRSRRNRQLIIALVLVMVAGFLLGLGMPIHA
jgi:TRAP-type uncharacterized transport system fused permease subunit